MMPILTPRVQAFFKPPFFKSTVVLLMLGISGLLPAANSAVSAAQPAAGDIRVTADRQDYSPLEGKTILTGNVKVAFRDIVVTGNRAEMNTNAAAGKVANFYNRPTFRRTAPSETTPGQKVEDKVIGDIIKVYLDDDRFGAIGNVDSYIATVAADPFTIRSDIQEFDTKNKVVSASGNVAVGYKDSQVWSNLANVRMKDDGKAERVIFSGDARLKQAASLISGNKITVMVDSGDLIAESHVKTQVDLQSKTPDNPSRVVITSDYQQYDKASDMMIASGHVKIIYGDYVAVGPKATFRMKDNDIDRIFLTGRPTITETGRVITADKITITTNPKNFEAVGNVNVNFKAHDQSSQPAAAKPAAAPSAGGAAAKPAGATPAKALPKDDPSDY